MNDKYLKYNALEFAQDDAFIRWVKEGGGRPGPWEAWLAQHPEKRKEAEEARLLIQAIAIKETPASQERIDAIWAKISQATGQAVAPAARPRLRLARWMGYAAAAALALLLAFFFLRPDGAFTEMQIPYGQVAQHTLPDGSTVSLNAGATIRYNKNTWAEARQIRLEGEAFFEVKKGGRFLVATPGGEVEVLGTSFNINTFEGRFDVHCYTGRVQVSAAGRQEILTAGQLAQWKGGSWQRSTFDANNSPGWQRGRFEYHSAPLRTVFAEMERQFDIHIEAPDSILNRTYSGAFERNDIDSALYRVCWPMKLETSKQGKTVNIQPAE